MMIIFSKKDCQGCNDLKEYLGSKLNDPKIKVMDINENPDMIDKYNIEYLPTTVLFDNKYQEVSRSIGFNETKVPRINKLLSGLI